MKQLEPILKWEKSLNLVVLKLTEIKFHFIIGYKCVILLLLGISKSFNFFPKDQPIFDTEFEYPEIMHCLLEIKVVKFHNLKRDL